MALASIMGPVYLVLGLSILMYNKQWTKLFTIWTKDHFSLFPLMILYIVVGLLSVQMYSVWALNVWVIVTLIGWLILLKGVAFFLVPEKALKAMMNFKNKRGVLYLASLVAILIGATLTYSVYFA